MLAIVCDCCGKTRLLSEDETYHRPSQFSVVTRDRARPEKFDLCEECTEKLVVAVRKGKTDESL
jgi:hypothetical protein